MVKFINFKVVGGVEDGAGTLNPGANGNNLLLIERIIDVNVEIATDGTMQAIFNLTSESGVTTCNVICSTSKNDIPSISAPISLNYIDKLKEAIDRAITSKPGGKQVDCMAPQDTASSTAFYNPELQVYWRAFNIPAIPLEPPLTNATLATAVADALALDPTGNTAIPVYGLMSNWNTSQVTSMNSLFAGQTSFNADISNWNVSNVTSFNSTFQGCSSFNQNLNNWDVSNSDDFTRMFWLCTNFNGDVTGWSFSTTAPSISFFQMFQSSNFNQNISGWNTERVGSMTSMLRSTPFNQDISGWDVTNVTAMGSMFRDNTAINQDLSSWNVTIVNFCTDFSLNAVQWVLPQPNFTACTP
jgi:surface protein